MGTCGGVGDRVRGTAAQVLLERGWGKPRVEVTTTHKSNSESFIEALQEVAKKVESSNKLTNASQSNSLKI